MVGGRAKVELEEPVLFMCKKPCSLRGLASPEMCITDMLANDIVAPWTRNLCGRCGRISVSVVCV